MTVQELLDLLQDQDPAAEVRLATQQAWPFEYSLRYNVVESDSEEEPVVWLVEGRQLGYLSGDVSERAWS